MTKSRPAIERFTEKYVKKLVVVDGKFLVCWIWTAGRNNRGYGCFRDGNNSLAHRWSYEHFVGPIPDGKQIDHYRCWNKMCVNPDHLRPATGLDNIRNGRTHNAVKTHCIRGHEFNLENTRITTFVIKGKKYKFRSCRGCYRDRAALRKAA